MKKTVLRKYAQLIAQMGANVQKGQDVIITAGLDQPEFVNMVAEECYKLKARKVTVDWTYQPLTITNVKYQAVKTLGSLDAIDQKKLETYVETLPCRIYIESDDPDGLKKMNMKKYAAASQKRYPLIKPYRDKMESKYQWVIAAVPGEKWAKKIYPELSKKQAIEKLWKDILACARVTDDPIQAWNDHNTNLKAKTSYLNSLEIKSLHYENSLGTNFDIELTEKSIFGGGYDTNINNGVTFNPNMPSEEAFTSPLNTSAEGIVYASKPLSYRGVLIDKFWIKFHEGKAVDWHAEYNNEALTTLINMDEGSCRLGECALVPFDSPIQNSGILFYNTLFDENAACHLALGFGFPDCIKGFENMSLDEIHALGVNASQVHEDFMIGTKDLNIVATTKSGKKVQIFKDGNWAF